MLELFIDKTFRGDTLAVIEQANEIIRDYEAQGYKLTLRQLYYQFVSRDYIPNTHKSYKRLGSIINDARLAGMVDWSAIEDRTRNVKSMLHLDDPADAVQTIRDQYGIDMWSNQDYRVEVWIEKEALTGVIASTCSELDVPYFACKGYVSQSEQWRAGRRFRGVDTIILHLGDHDPSGIDMTRDNSDRLTMFARDVDNPEVRRIALNMDQVDQYDPPPNFAKMTDSRFSEYSRNYGNESWELDALEPSVLNTLIFNEVDKIRDMDLWQERVDQLAADIAVLDDIIEQHK
jgi:hypothetical protein